MYFSLQQLLCKMYFLKFAAIAIKYIYFKFAAIAVKNVF
jgi:hypothetical protein